MYVSGVIVAFSISFLVLMYQSTVRIKHGEETFLYGLIMSIVVSLIYSLFSWLAVLILLYTYLKMRKRAQESKLFTAHEKSLLYKSQRVIQMNNNALVKPHTDIVAVAELIEDSRIEYQIMNEAGRVEIAFINFLLPRIELLKLEIADWDNVNNYFNIY